MGKCKVECIVDSKNDKCCLECEEYKTCNMVCDDLDCYEYVEDCPDYVEDEKVNDGN